MKIKYKAASGIALFGGVIVLLLSGASDLYIHRIVVNKEMENNKNISKEIALHLESHLKEKAIIAMTISSAPIIRESLLESNAEFAELSEENRKKEIDSRNQKWMGTADIDDPFIQTHMTSNVAEYLKYQKIIIPGEYGEIFLTNRYGVMIASTNKLTTLAHAHKYWWMACYNDGQGRIFLDDRGFDLSVQDYVLGVVVPIKDGNEIIGMLKCNIKIMGQLTDVIQEYSLHHSGRMKIVRTGGLIVSEDGVPPLSTQAGGALVELLEEKKSGAAIIVENNEDQLVAFSPVQLTMGSEEFGFGGREESMDQIRGNRGEAWHVVVSRREKDAIEIAHEVTLIIIAVGMTFILLTAAVALFLGRLAARSIVELAATAQIIGAGNLHARAKVPSNDEIGSLAKSLNRMAENIQATMTSKNELVSEIERRKKVEEKLRLLSTTDELTGAYNRRAFNEYLQTNIGRVNRYHEPLSMLMLDIDHFKKINDSYGHDVGDVVLKSLVGVINESIRREDILARWGGEEFVILLPQTEKDAALHQAERLRKRVSEHAFPEIGHITVSVGHTELQNEDSADSFIKRADDALYRAKKSGRNVVISC